MGRAGATIAVDAVGIVKDSGGSDRVAAVDQEGQAGLVVPRVPLAERAGAFVVGAATEALNANLPAARFPRRDPAGWLPAPLAVSGVGIGPAVGAGLEALVRRAVVAVLAVVLVVAAQAVAPVVAAQAVAPVVAAQAVALVAEVRAQATEVWQGIVGPAHSKAVPAALGVLAPIRRAAASRPEP